MTSATRRRRPDRALVGLLAAVAAMGIAAIRGHTRGARGREVPGGILIRDAGSYDAIRHRLLGGFFRGIAADVSATIPAGGHVLEVGCGPGRLAILLARGGVDVTGVDLDPEMIERARANAHAAVDGDGGRPTFMVADAASLPFPDGSFDLAVSTLSMHHWADATKGLDEVARVLRPDGRALVWDLRPGGVPLHRATPDPVEPARASSLRVVSATPWRWPWPFRPTQRIELVRKDLANRIPQPAR
jgi:SAM-dependent methyltransferase